MIRHARQTRHRDSFPARLAASLALLLASAGTVTPAAAAPAEAVLVWPRNPGVSTDGLAAAMQDAGLRSRDFGPLRARMQTEHEAETTATRAALDAVEHGLASARAAFLSQRYDAMITALTTAETAAVATLPAGPLCAATLWEIEFQIGLGLLTRARPGDLEGARARFALALALDDVRRPIAGLYGPDVALVYVQSIDEAARRPARPVRPVLTPTDARLTVDCRRLPDEPALRPGLHIVRVDAPGHRPHTEVLPLTEPALHVTLLRTPDAPLGGWWRSSALDPASPSARTAVHAYSGAARVVWLDEVDARHVARLIVDGDIKRVARADSAGEAVVLALTTDAPAPTPTPPRPRKRLGLWLGLAGVALGGLALGLGLGLGLPAADARLQLVVP